MDFWSNAEMGYIARCTYLDELVDELVETGNISANDLTQNEQQYILNEYHKRRG